MCSYCSSYLFLRFAYCSNESSFEKVLNGLCKLNALFVVFRPNIFKCNNFENSFDFGWVLGGGLGGVLGGVWVGFGIVFYRISIGF